MDKCKICGQTSHTKEVNHMNKSQIYMIIAKGIELVDRRYFSGEEFIISQDSWLRPLAEFGFDSVFLPDQSRKIWYPVSGSAIIWEASDI